LLGGNCACSAQTVRKREPAARDECLCVVPAKRGRILDYIPKLRHQDTQESVRSREALLLPSGEAWLGGLLLLPRPRIIWNHQRPEGLSPCFPTTRFRSCFWRFSYSISHGISANVIRTHRADTFFGGPATHTTGLLPALGANWNRRVICILGSVSGHIHLD
jgi:hypothetical protein